MKLLEKERIGAKVSKKYDDAKTLFQRVLLSEYINQSRKSPRTWLTRKDPFEHVWDEIRLRMELAPENNAKKMVMWLMDKYPDKFSIGQTRTLQRRIAQWRQTKRVRKKNCVI